MHGMGHFAGIFSGFFGLIMVLITLSMIIMWFSAPILLYAIYQQLKQLNDKLKK
jgi:hypothetical protein